MREISRAEVLSMIREKQGKMTLKDFAASLGALSPGYISDVLLGHRAPGHTLLDLIGVVKHTTTTYATKD